MPDSTPQQWIQVKTNFNESGLTQVLERMMSYIKTLEEDQHAMSAVVARLVEQSESVDQLVESKLSMYALKHDQLALKQALFDSINQIGSVETKVDNIAEQLEKLFVEQDEEAADMVNTEVIPLTKRIRKLEKQVDQSRRDIVAERARISILDESMQTISPTTMSSNGPPNDVAVVVETQPTVAAVSALATRFDELNRSVVAAAHKIEKVCSTLQVHESTLGQLSDTTNQLQSASYVLPQVKRSAEANNSQTSISPLKSEDFLTRDEFAHNQQVLAKTITRRFDAFTEQIKEMETQKIDLAQIKEDVAKQIQLDLTGVTSTVTTVSRRVDDVYKQLKEHDQIFSMQRTDATHLQAQLQQTNINFKAVQNRVFVCEGDVRDLQIRCTSDHNNHVLHSHTSSTRVNVSSSSASSSSSSISVSLDSPPPVLLDLSGDDAMKSVQSAILQLQKKTNYADSKVSMLYKMLAANKGAVTNVGLQESLNMRVFDLEQRADQMEVNIQQNTCLVDDFSRGPTAPAATDAPPTRVPRLRSSRPEVGLRSSFPEDSRSLPASEMNVVASAELSLAETDTVFNKEQHEQMTLYHSEQLANHKVWLMKTVHDLHVMRDALVSLNTKVDAV